MNAYQQTTLTFLVVLFISLTQGHVYKKYQNFPPPECPMNAVCAQIYALPSKTTAEATYFNFINCKCPTGLYCPKVPGSQTIRREQNRWYGLCQRVDELKTCESDEDAEQILVDPYNFAGPSYTRIQCQCPVNEMTGSSATTEIAGTTTDSSEAKTIYHFTCGFGGFDEAMDKRGRYYGGSNRRKFYFYK